MFLRRQPDSTYALDICKDDKKAESRGKVFLDSAIEVVVSELYSYMIHVSLNKITASIVRATAITLITLVILQ